MNFDTAVINELKDRLDRSQAYVRELQRDLSRREATYTKEVMLHAVTRYERDEAELEIGRTKAELVERIIEVENALRTVMTQAMLAGMKDTPLYGIPETALRIRGKS